MKKSIQTISVAITLALFTSTTTFADSNNVKVDRTIIDEVEIINGEEVVVKGVKLTTTESPIDSLMVGIQATPGERNASIVCKSPFFGDFHAIAKSEATYQQDTIGAKARVFNKDAKLLASDSDSQSNSTISSATATVDGNVGVLAYAVGNHTFQRDGFEDWYPETKDYF